MTTDRRAEPMDRRSFLLLTGGLAATSLVGGIPEQLAWLMAQKPWIVPISGTTQLSDMLENIGAAEVRLTSAELPELNAAVSAIQIRGARLPDQVLVFSGVEAPPKK